MLRLRLSSLLAVNLLAVALFGRLIFSRFHYPFPALTETLSTSVTQLSDFIGIALGFRRFAADLAWIQTLTYYGTHEPIEPGQDVEEALHGGGGRYYDFLAYCQRTVRLDPYFTYVYYYGAAVLGWNLHRLDEAERFIMEGIQFNPKEWRLQQYLAAMSYQKNHDIEKLIQFLDQFAYEPDCPNLLRALLANLYKKIGRNRDAIRIWLLVEQTGDPEYVSRARAQIQWLARQSPSPSKS